MLPKPRLTRGFNITISNYYLRSTYHFDSSSFRMPRIRPIQRPGKLALMQRVIENKRRRIEDVDRNRDGDQSIAVSLLTQWFTTVYSLLLDANFFNLL